MLSHRERTNKRTPRLKVLYLAAEEELAKQGLRTTPALGPVKNEYYLGNVMDVGFTEHAKTIPVLAGSVQCEAALGRVWHPYDLPAEEKDKLLSDYFGEYKDELIELFDEDPCQEECRRCRAEDIKQREPL